MEKYKLGKTPVEMPTGWQDINYNKAIQILTSEMSSVEMLALLSNKTVKQIRAATDIKTIFYFVNAFTFINRLPEKINEFPRSVVFGPDRLVFPWVSYADEFDLGKADVGQVEDMIEMLKTKSAEFIGDEDRELLEPLELIQITPYFVAIYLHKILEGEYDGEKAMKLVERVKEELSFKEVVSIGTFFLTKLPNYINGSPSVWKQYNSSLRRLKRAWKNLIQRLVSLRP